MEFPFDIEIALYELWEECIDEQFRHPLSAPYFPDGYFSDKTVENGVGDSKAPVGSDPAPIPESEPIPDADTVINSDNGVDASEDPVAESSHPAAVPVSDPIFGSDALMEVEGASHHKGKRRKRARGSWRVCNRSDPLLGSDAPADTVEVESGSNRTAVDSSEVKRGKERKRSRRGTKDRKARPSWLPEGWTMTCKTRTNGASAGVIDRYYVEPTTLKRFRSMVAVKRYLEIGTPSDTTGKDREKSGTTTQKMDREEAP